MGVWHTGLRTLPGAGRGVREENMPIVHQDHGFDFTIKAEDMDPIGQKPSKVQPIQKGLQLC